MKRPIQLSLDAVSDTIKRGESPTFKLTIRNVGDAPERIIDLTGKRRRDLQDTYYYLEVTQAGKLVDVPRIISDPGPVVEQDFVELKPGEQVTFDLTRFPSMFGWLPPGKYQGRVCFRQDPFAPWENAFYSPDAEFTVGE